MFGEKPFQNSGVHNKCSHAAIFFGGGGGGGIIFVGGGVVPGCAPGLSLCLIAAFRPTVTICPHVTHTANGKSTKSCSDTRI